MFLNPPPPYHLRAMRLADVEKIMPIERDSFPTPWPSAGYRHELTHNDKAYYIILSCRDDEQGERVIGYAGYWYVADEAHVSTIAVDTRYRGRGLGSLLLLQIIVHCIELGATAIRLEVRQSNRVARQLYARYGFTSVGRRKGYYRDRREDAILMDLDLARDGVRSRLQACRDQLWRKLGAVGDGSRGDSAFD